jgi:hypothetical protein
VVPLEVEVDLLRADVVVEVVEDFQEVAAGASPQEDEVEAPQEEGGSEVDEVRLNLNCPYLAYGVRLLVYRISSF